MTVKRGIGRMLRAECKWLRSQLSGFDDSSLSPLLDLGSSTRAFRESEQPWIAEEVFAPLVRRRIEIVHVDVKGGEGVDVRADILDDAGLETLRAAKPHAILLCNLLEHVAEPAALARRCVEILPSCGLVFVTGPYSYPHHRDPIDTMFRPSPEALAQLFAGMRMLAGTILDAGESYRDEIRRRPWIVLRHVLRLPVPFLDLDKWTRSMQKLYWLAHNYELACAVFQKSESSLP